MGDFSKPNENQIKSYHCVRNDKMNRMMVLDLKFVKK